jgi:hypothetical protein
MTMIKLTPEAARLAMITDDEIPQPNPRFKTARQTKVQEYVVHKPGKMSTSSFLSLRSDQQRIIHPKQKWRNLRDSLPAYSGSHCYLETTSKYDRPVFFRVHPYVLEKPPAAGKINHTVMALLEDSHRQVKSVVSAGQFGKTLVPVGNSYERVGSHDWDLLTFSTNCTDPSGPVTLPSGHVVGPPDYSITYAELMQAILPYIRGPYVCWSEKYEWCVAVEDHNASTEIKLYFG